MAVDVRHKRYAFSRSVEQLANKSPNRSLLKEVVSRQRMSGNSFFVDGAGTPLDIESRVANSSNPENFKGLSNIRTTRVHEDDASDTYAEYRLMETPHLEMRRQRTLFVPEIVEAGVWLNELDPIEEIIDTKGAKLQDLMNRIFAAEDYEIVQALLAGSVPRVAGASQITTTEDIIFPISQKVVADHGTYSGELSDDVYALVREKFSENFRLGAEPIYMIISPLQGRHLIQNSSGTIHSKDFITRQGLFERGEFPEIFGIRTIEHPYCPDNIGLAFQPSGIRWGQFQDMKTDMDKSPDRRFETVAYVREYAQVRRVDDYKCVQLVLDQSASAGTQTT